MKRHSWKNDVCTRCGLTRLYKEQKKLQRFYSGERQGIVTDIPVYRYHIRYHYGEKHGFNRPDCE